ALCLALTGAAQPALAGGLISTEQVAVRTAAGGDTAATGIAAQRRVLVDGMVAAGVDRRHAQDRLDALTDAEVADLTSRYDSAPAGGLWFAPFLLVAVVIGALIGSRERSAGAPTDLFGRPRTVAATP
ncbi:MAG: PA2779 family protein, partial [Ideonella sp.]|nr:PA2779 family protein [Ideonella sp.]